MSRRALVCGAALLLSGCASLAPLGLGGQQDAEKAWASLQARNAAISAFELKGRVAGGAQAIKADLLWQQSADGQFRLRVSGPLGAGSILLSGRPDEVTVKTREGSFVTEDPEAWLATNLGLRLPVTALRHWVLGLPSPASDARLQVRADGSPATLEQDGWRLAFTAFEPQAGHRLPRRIEASDGSTRLILIADQWSGLP